MRDAPIPDITTLRAAACEMSARGLTPHDIGAVFHLDPASIRRLLATQGTEAAELHAATWLVARRTSNAFR
jgi:hypothetical protein